MPSLRTLHLALLLSAGFILSTTAAPAPYTYMDTSDPPLRTTSIAKKRAFTEDDMLNIARSLSAKAFAEADRVAPVQMQGQYGYSPADSATMEGLQRIMDSPMDVGVEMGEHPC